VEKYRGHLRLALVVLAIIFAGLAAFEIKDAMKTDELRVAVQGLTSAVLALAAMEGVRFLED